MERSYPVDLPPLYPTATGEGKYNIDLCSKASLGAYRYERCSAPASSDGPVEETASYPLKSFE